MQGVNQTVAHRGLKLPGQVRRRLRDVGIVARPELSLEHQHLARRYVLRGVESGGAVREAGHYVSFADEGGEPLAYLHPIDAIGVNGLHALVVAPTLVRVEMLRTGRTYELLITGHRVGEAEKGHRPPIESKVLFQGVHGYLDAELWRKDKEHTGAVMPIFYLPRRRAGHGAETIRDGDTRRGHGDQLLGVFTFALPDCRSYRSDGHGRDTASRIATSGQ